MNAKILYIVGVIQMLFVGFAFGDEIGTQQTYPNTSLPNEQKDESKTPQNIQKVQLSKSTATADKEYEAYQSGNQVGTTMLQSNPSGNGDITSILRILPNVQYDNSQLSSATPGEISPANISISGGLFYQNNFQLDGFNMNNDINPANQVSTPEGRPDATTSVSGRSQGLNIDTSLLDSIVVQDSNISALYGKFTGGLIQANTRKAQKEFGASISYQITQGQANPNKFSLTNYHIYGDLETFLNSSYSSNQPTFTKHIIRTSVESKINDKLSVISSFSTIQSFIPLKGYTDITAGRVILDNVDKTQTRQSYNFFLKANYDYSKDLVFEFSYAYAPEINKYFSINQKNSDFDFRQGGHQLGGKALWDNQAGNLSVLANLNYLENSRSNSANDYAIWLSSPVKNWSGTSEAEEGGYGNEDNKSLNIDVKLIQDFKPFNALGLEHKLSAGAELGFGYAYFKRYEDTNMAMSGFYLPLPNGATCTDSRWCTEVPPDDPNGGWYANDDTFAGINGGYYFAAMNKFLAGEVNMYNFTTSAFAQDDINIDLNGFGEINTRLGLRADYETYMNHIPLAPRFSFSYITPTSKEWQTQITFGANRYYGRNLFSYRLSAGREDLDWQYWKIDPADMFNAGAQIDSESVPYENARYQVYNGGIALTDLINLKTPYDDELMAGIKQNISAFELGVKYIHRFGRDQVMRKCQDSSSTSSSCRRVWSNDGKSDSDIISLSVNNIEPLLLYDTKHFFMLSADYTQSKRNFNTYSSTFLNNQLTNQIISYNGQFIRYADRPAENFYRPYSIRFTTTHQFDISRTKCFLNNFFRFRSGYDAMISVSDDLKDTYNGAKVETFRVQKVPFSFSWDMRVGFELPMYKRHTIFVNVDIYNVLDRKNMAVLNLSALRSNAGATAVPTYEVGRQFWVQVGYKI